MDSGLVWALSIVLAVVFLATGVVKMYRYEQAQKFWPWVAELPEIIVKIIGGLEILGAVGLIVPAAISSYTWLAPIAAGSLAMLMLMAVVFQMRRKDSDTALLNLVLAIMLLVVTYLRWVESPLL